MLYNKFSDYLRLRYGKKIRKICIDGGFSCPNRDGKCGTGGCIYCGERGSGEHLSPELSIAEQVRSSLKLQEGRADGFIAYFQNFTNTYAPAEVLRARYDAALIDNRIVALAIGTRPDCIDKERAALIASYKDRLDVWVELGLQTASDKTAMLINRGYDRAEFERAAAILKEYKIPIVVHTMIGLPGEGDGEIRELAEYLSRFDIFGIKIHSVYVMAGTVLEKMYNSGAYTPITLEEYTARSAYLISHLNPEVVIHRLTGDCPKNLLVAPEWSADKSRVIREIEGRLLAAGERQGSHFQKG